MEHLVGSILFVYGSWLAVSGINHRRRHLAAPPPSADGSLAILGDILPPLIMIGLGLAALEIVLAYVMVAPTGWFSLFDLAGVLYAIAAYGAWMLIKTKYRGGH